MHALALSFTVALVLCACGAPEPPTETPQTSPDTTAQAFNDPEHVLPAHIQAVWELPAPERWDTYWIEQYADSTTGTLGHRTADLDGDGALDHAYLLTRRDTARRDSTYALFVQFGNARDTVLTVEPWAEMEGIGMGLTLEPPGPLGHLGGEEGGEPEGTVDLKQPAITLVYFEKASITWYWKDGSFQKVWTGD